MGCNVSDEYIYGTNEGNFTHAFYWAPKTSTVTSPQPKRTTESILENGGWWNERGELVNIKVLKNVGGIIGGVFTALDFYSDYMRYDGLEFGYAIATDVIPPACGYIGGGFIPVIEGVVGESYLRIKIRDDIGLER